ncbi:MAG: glycosyltransferase family 2 protein [Nitrospinae bacterium]|nr:glycosyltransferase family 2 protein [Nitrospinota bacterium]
MKSTGKALVICSSRQEKIVSAVKNELEDFLPENIIYLGNDSSPFSSMKNITFLSWGKGSFTLKAAWKTLPRIKKLNPSTVLLPINNFKGEGYYLLRLFARKIAGEKVLEVFPDERVIELKDSFVVLALSGLEKWLHIFIQNVLELFSDYFRKKYGRNLPTGDYVPPQTPLHYKTVQESSSVLNPDVSIVIRSFNEEEFMKKNLEAIFSQKDVSFEVILIDSGSTDATVEIANEFPLRIYTIEKSSFSYPGVLNLGAELCKGKIMVNISAHAIPVNNEWLKNLIEPLKNPHVAGVHGAEMPMEGRCGLLERIRLEGSFRKNIIERKNDHTFSNANSAMPIALVKQFPFNEALNWAEDQYWTYQLQKAGYITIYTPHAKVYHSHNLDMEGDFIRCYKYFKVVAQYIYQEESNKLRKDWRQDLAFRSMEFRRFLTGGNHMSLIPALFYAPFCEFIFYLGCDTACREYFKGDATL